METAAHVNRDVPDSARAGDSAEAPAPARGSAGRRRVPWRRWAEIALLAGPGVVVFVTFVIVPVLMAGYYGFFEWSGYGVPTEFVGLRNYELIFTDTAFLEALSHNGFILVMSLIMQGPVAIGIALLLNRKMRGRSLIRVLIFVPYVISEVIVAIGFSLMLHPTGAVNDVLDRIGLGGLATD
jgi:raffinose/stachyose/melibiose transport system permease protein